MRIANIGLTCPEVMSTQSLPGHSFGLHYDKWIYVPGGAITLGYYDPFSVNALEPGLGLPASLRKPLLLTVQARIIELFDDGAEVNIRVADAFWHEDCGVNRKLMHTRAPRLPFEEQAVITFKELIEQVKRSRQYNKRSRLSVEKLKPNVYQVEN